MRSLPPLARAHTWGKASKIASRGAHPPPLPYSASPELRKAAAESAIVGPAIAPISTKRVLDAAIFTSWRVRAAKVLGNLDGKLACDPGRPKNQDHLARLELGAPDERKPSR
jgi:hypothetical protein